MKKNILKSLCEISDYIFQSSHLVLGLDFDGTLTPILDVPSSVFIGNKMRSLLHVLSKRENITIAIISGKIIFVVFDSVHFGHSSSAHTYTLISQTDWS